MQIKTLGRTANGLRRIGDAVRARLSADAMGWFGVAILAVVAVIAANGALTPSRSQPSAEAPTTSRDISLIAALTPAADMAGFTFAPAAIRPLSPAEARAWNQTLPFSADPIRPAPALIAPASDIEAYSRALDCLTAAVYYEAASEPPQGQAAVAQVVLNRTRHPAYPRSICGVVFQGSERATGCQFSFTCDGAMNRAPSSAGWARARSAASAALNGAVVPAVGMATHFHTDWVAPYWAPRLAKVAVIGTHIFYRWKGAWGLPSAFSGIYPGLEPVIPRLHGLISIQPEAPVEITLATGSAQQPAAEFFEHTEPRLMPSSVGVPDAQISEIEALRLPTALPAHTPRVAPGNTPVMADPMASPSVTPGLRRQRIAAPSDW